MHTPHDNPGRTLVIQPLPGIGDTIWHLPHLRAIADAATDRSISLLTKERSLARDLLAGANHVRDVLYLEADGDRHSGPFGGWRLGSDLRSHGFGTVWILHGSVRYALAACRAGIRKRIGYGIGWQDALLTSPHNLSRRDQTLSTIGKANRLLELHGLSVSDTRPELPIPDAILQVTKTSQAALHGPAIALAIGSSESFKQWGVDRFGDLIAASRERLGCSFVLVGGAGDTIAARQLTDRFQNPDWLLTVIGAPILEAAAFVSGCKACVGNDTGMLQVAAACGTTSLGLFGGSVPLNQDTRIFPLSPPGNVQHGENRMAEISVDMVLESLRSLDLR